MNENHKNSSSLKAVSAVVLGAAVLAILFLTLQSHSQTTGLSHPVYLWFREHGFIGTEHELRSRAHIPEYFFLGLALSFYGLVRSFRPRWILLAGALCGLADETLKIFLPTREFDFGDWIMDVIGIVLALSLCLVIKAAQRRSRS